MNIAGAKPPNTRPLQSTSDRSLTPTALYPVTEPQWAASSSSFIPSESDSPPQHIRSHNNFCYSENVPSLYEWEHEFTAPQDGFYFVYDPCNPSRIRLPQSSIPLPELQVAGHCPAIVDEIYDRFCPRMVLESMTREDVEYNFCTAMDARHLL